MKKFCICVMMLCIIGVISGCHPAEQTVSNDQQEHFSIDEENAFSTKPQNSGMLIPVSTNNFGKEFELSDTIVEKTLANVRILKDNRYGNEYFIVTYGEAIGIYPRIRN